MVTRNIHPRRTAQTTRSHRRVHIFLPSRKPLHSPLGRPSQPLLADVPTACLSRERVCSADYHLSCGSPSARRPGEDGRARSAVSHRHSLIETSLSPRARKSLRMHGASTHPSISRRGRYTGANTTVARQRISPHISSPHVQVGKHPSPDAAALRGSSSSDTHSLSHTHTHTQIHDSR